VADRLVAGAAGTLYVVATPLGNLGDLTARAAELLRAVAIVAAEDTRRTRGLLAHLDAHPDLVSFHAHSDPARAAELVERLRRGESVALVTDAGTPGVSDPGPELVRAVREAGLPVVPIPGPSAVTAAISASGFPADRYLFLGFAPRKGAERDRWLGQAARSEVTVVCYEAPNRLAELLADLARTAGSERRALVARELTKLHEELREDTLAQLARHFGAKEPRGELTLVIAPATPAVAEAPDPGLIRAAAGELLAAGRSRKDAVAHLAARFGIARNDAYRIVMEAAPGS
jgi:16S rRNA (cytidine1402-2'-O)-methyltransferase